MYRLIYFSPEPWTGERFCIAAAVDDGNGVQVVRVVPPCSACIGSGPSAELLRLIMRDLEHVRSIGNLPVSLGPHVSYEAESRRFPDGVLDCVAFVRGQLPKRGCIN